MGDDEKALAEKQLGNDAYKKKGGDSILQFFSLSLSLKKGFSGGLRFPPTLNKLRKMSTGIPAYSDTGYSDTVRSSPLTVTLF